MIEFVQGGTPSRQHHGQGTAFTQEEIVRIAFYRGQGKSMRDISLLVNRGKTVVDDILVRYQDMSESAPRFTKPAAVSNSPFITPERWLLRHYSLYIVAVDLTLSVRQIAEELNQEKFPFRAEKTRITDELANVFMRSGRPILTPRLTEKKRIIEKSFLQQYRLM
jgi:hypothetical protein